MKKPIKNKGIKYWLWYNFFQDFEIVWITNCECFYRNNITGIQHIYPAKMILKVDNERKHYKFYITDGSKEKNLNPELYFNDSPELKNILDNYKNYKNIGL